MADQPQPPLDLLVDRLLADADRDAEAIANRLLGGDFSTDAVPVNKQDELAMRAEQWVKEPQSAQQWKDSVLPEDFINEAIDAMAPDFSKEARQFFFEAIEAGIQPLQAMGMANQYDRTIKMQHDPNAFAIPQMPMLGAPPMPMQPMPAPPMAPPMPVPQPMPGGM